LKVSSHAQTVTLFEDSPESPELVLLFPQAAKVSTAAAVTIDASSFFIFIPLSFYLHG